MSDVTTRERREILWRRDPRCFWCGVTTILPPEGKTHGEKRPENLATLDHLRSRWNQNRGGTNRAGEFATVLSCWKCNNERDRAERASVGIEAQREKCGNYPVTVERVKDLAKRYGDARRALLDLYRTLPPVRDGLCIYCESPRRWPAGNCRPDPCTNPRCITHRAEKVIGNGATAWPKRNQRQSDQHNEVVRGFQQGETPRQPARPPQGQGESVASPEHDPSEEGWASRV